MGRALLHGILGLCLGLSGSVADADDWRPARTTAPATTIGLGKPVAVRSATAPTQPALQTVSLSRPAPASPLRPFLPPTPTEPRTVVRGQSPVGSEEQFNCGVVTEGPPPSGAGGWVQGAWTTGPQQSFNTLVGGPVTWCSDVAFSRFISPVSNPFFFEDPRALTELRPIFMYQSFPGDTKFITDNKTGATQTFNGGSAYFFGLQGRLAINERFSFVLHKLGGISASPNGPTSDVFGDETGFAEVALGPKFTFYRDDNTGTVLAFGTIFEAAVGSDKLAQNTGSGAITPYVSFGQEFLRDWHFLTTFGYRFRFDEDRSNSFYLSAHLDYGIMNRFFPLVEVNWYHYVSNGQARGADFEGADLFNFGSDNVQGSDVVTLAAGVRFKITEWISAGIVYEFPLTSKDDLLDYRITADMIFRW